MSNDKALAIIPKSLDEVNSLAEVLAKSTLLPDALRGKVPDVVVSILAGQELGLSPMAAIRGVHVVQGKPVLSADTMVALVLRSGLAEYFTCVEDTDARVTYETKRKGSPQPQRLSWTAEDTKRAGLNTKDSWRLYPRSMMKARAKSLLARDVYPDVIAGVYSDDEIQVPATAPPIRAPEPIPEVEDAVLVEDTWSPALKLISEAQSVEQLKATSEKLSGVNFNGHKAEVEAAYKARLKDLRDAEKAA